MFVQQSRAKGGVLVAGTIVDVETSTSRTAGQSEWSTFHAPVIEFTDASGATHRFTPNLAGAARPVVGTERMVSYHPDNPARAVLVEEGNERAAKWVFLVVGVAAVVGAVIATIAG